MDTRQMRWLLAIAEHGSFAKAADALGVSQPSLSAAMARLEDRLGGTLFHRTPMGSQLTPFGEIILERVAKVVAEIDEIREDARLIARGETGVLRIGLGAMLPKPLSMGLATRLARAHPRSRLRFSVLERERVLSDLQKSELDLVICAEHDGFDDDQLTTKRVLTSEILAVCSANHPLAHRASITPEEFYSYPSAASSIGAYNVDSVIERPRGLAEAGRYEANAYHVLLPLVLSGSATLIAPAYCVEPHLNEGSLVQINIKISAWVRFYAVAKKSVLQMPLAQSAISIAEQLGAEFERSLAPPTINAWLKELLTIS